MNGGGPSPRASSRHCSVLSSGGYGGGGPYSLLSPGSEGSSIESMGGHLGHGLDMAAVNSETASAPTTLPDTTHVMMPAGTMYSQVPVLASSSAGVYPHEAVQYVTNLGPHSYTSEPSYNPYIPPTSAEAPISYVVSSEATALNLSNAVPLFASAPTSAPPSRIKCPAVAPSIPSAPPTIAISYIQSDGNTATYEAVPVVNTEVTPLTTNAAVVVEHLPILPPLATSIPQIGAIAVELPEQTAVPAEETQDSTANAAATPHPTATGTELASSAPASTA